MASRLPGGGSGKRPRPSSSSGSSSSDPDGRPARFREVLLRKPGLAASIEKWMLSLRRRRSSAHNGVVVDVVPTQLVPKLEVGGGRLASGPGAGGSTSAHTMHLSVGLGGFAGQATLVGARSKAKNKSSGRLSAEAKGKRPAVEAEHVALVPGGSRAAGRARGAAATPSAAVGSGRTEWSCPLRSAGGQETRSFLPPPFVVVNGMMRRPPLEPLKLFRGRSFVKHFNQPFKQSIEVPQDFWLMIPNRATSSVIIFGDSNMGYPVDVEEFGDRCMFTGGWHAFVNAERISRYDTGVFAWLGSNVIGMRLYGPSGVERPHCRRPSIGHPMLDDFDGPAANHYFGRPNVYVPRCIKNMVFDIGSGVLMNGNVMQTLANVWHNEESSYPLFVCKITKSQVNLGGHFFFGTIFSKYLVNGTPAILLSEDSMVAHHSEVVFFRSTSTVARLVRGWFEFAAFSGLDFNATYVVKIRETGGGVYRIRFFRVGVPRA